MQFWALIVDSFRESRDRKIFWVMLVMSLVVAAGMFCVGIEPGKLTILFGLWEFETDFFTSSNQVRPEVVAAVVVDGIMDMVLAWVGVLLAIIATASFFPAFMQRGAIDVVLAKPMPRWKLFLGRYFGAMAFLLVHACVFVVSTFLVVGLRWKVWLPGYLLVIPLIVLLFSYLYCISALVGVYFRSTVAAVLLTLAAWVAFTGVQLTGDSFETFPEWKEYRLAYQTVKVARWIVPKTHDITYLAKRWTGSAQAAELIREHGGQDRELVDRASAAEAVRMAIPAVQTIGSSLLFEAVVVLLAMWKFTRIDF